MEARKQESFDKKAKKIQSNSSVVKTCKLLMPVV